MFAQNYIFQDKKLLWKFVFIFLKCVSCEFHEEIGQISVEYSLFLSINIKSNCSDIHYHISHMCTYLLKVTYCDLILTTLL
jgi:hypothetical protein